nr:reverse transcriptase domain-containing protein [Tanacetum cinerariifolium]
MPPRMRTQSAGRPAAESLGEGTGVRVGRGGSGRRPKEGNDERVDDLNGQGNDQGMGANEGVEGINGNGKGSNGALIAKVLKEKSVNEAEVLTVVEEEGNTWMTPIYEYLMEETLPVEKKKASSVRLKSRRYAVINGVLYKKYFLEPWLRCVGPLQANYVIKKIHEVSCSMHAGRSVVAKAIRIGYYWPTMHKDARKVIRKFQDCQVHRLVPRNPQQKLNPITSSWLFSK